MTLLQRLSDHINLSNIFSIAIFKEYLKENLVRYYGKNRYLKEDNKRVSQ